MHMHGSVIPPDTSSVLYPLIGTQGLIIFLTGLAIFLSIWRLKIFSASGGIILGREITLSSWRDALFSTQTEVLSEVLVEPLAFAIIRIGFGVLWLFDAVLQAKPNMPSDMVNLVIQPALLHQPPFVAWLMHGGIYFWQYNPVAADAATMWVQAAIGILFILGTKRPIRKLAGIASIIWGTLIWIFGEGFGMLFAPGNSFLSGAPGAALFYAVVGGLLLLSDTTIQRKDFFRIARKSLGGFWIAMAVLEAAPFEGFWSGTALSGIFQAMSTMSMPSYVTSPMTFMANATSLDPALWNAVFVGIMLLIGIGIFLSPNPRGYAYASIAFATLVWWVGMGFGFLAASGTDPNSSVPLIILSVALLLIGDKKRVRRKYNSGYPGEPKALGITIAVIAIAVGTIPMIASIPAAASDSSLYAAVSDGGGLTPLNKPAPNFSLTDQYGRRVSLGQFRNKAVVITFLDPVCYDVCPVMSGEITRGVARLGNLRNNVVMLAIDINPAFTTVSSIRQFDLEHGLSNIHNWFYLTGSLPALQKVWQNYAVTPSVGPVGMLSHPQVIYFIDKRGTEIALTGDSGSGAVTLVHSYADLISSTVKVALGAT